MFSFAYATRSPWGFLAGAAILASGMLGISIAENAAIAASPSEIHALGEKGPYEIGFESYLLFDTDRLDRPVPLYVFYPVDPGTVSAATSEAWYPLDPVFGYLPSTPSSAWETYGLDRAYQEPEASLDGPFPLVMFSPGWGAPAWAHLSIGTRLASHGFVVAIATHFGDGSLPWEPLDHIALAAYNRPRDISFALDQMLAWNDAPGHLLEGSVQPDRVAAAGWSLGGYAALVLAGGDDDVCDRVPVPVPDDLLWTCTESPPDPRIGAIAVLDSTNQLLFFDELARIETPAMSINEEWATLAAFTDPSSQARLHAALSANPAYRVDLADTIHSGFSDQCILVQVLGDYGIYPPDYVEYVLATECIPFLPHAVASSLITKYMAGFLTTQLAGESGYERLLTPGWALTKEPEIEFFVTEKQNARAIDDEPDTFVYFPHQPGAAHAIGLTDPPEVPPIPYSEVPR